MSCETRCSTEQMKTIKLVAGEGGVVAGTLQKTNDLINFPLYAADAGDEYVACYAAEKGELDKAAAIMLPGETLYYDPDNANVTNVAGELQACGTCLASASETDETVLADFRGY